MLSSPARAFLLLFFFFNDTATTEIYTLSLHDALPILLFPHRRAGYRGRPFTLLKFRTMRPGARNEADAARLTRRSEEHTSELQSQSNLVCRLLLEKKKKKTKRRSRQINSTANQEHSE